VLRQFTVPQADYPCGLVEYDDEHKLYLTDRRLAGQSQQRIFVYDTAGTILDTIIHPQSGYYGSRCLALDYRTPTNPPSFVNIFTWFDAQGTTLDSTGMLEIDRVGNTIMHHYRFTNTAWNIRGVEVDPRDGSYWVTIMQGGTTDNQILKVVGFNYGVGVEEERPGFRVDNRPVLVSAMPNPFTRGTVLSVSLVQPGRVDLRVYDNNGRMVRELAAGANVAVRGSFLWDGRDDAGRSVAPGIYFYRVQAVGNEAWGKVVLSN
jgi:hypothetical protein